MCFDDIDIVLDVFNAKDKNGDTWTYEELDDMIDAFCKTLNNIIGQEDVVSGFIEMSPLSS